MISSLPRKPFLLSVRPLAKEKNMNDKTRITSEYQRGYNGTERSASRSQPTQSARQADNRLGRRSRDDTTRARPGQSVGRSGRSARSHVDTRRHHRLLSQQRMRDRAAAPVLVLRIVKSAPGHAVRAEKEVTGKTVPMGTHEMTVVKMSTRAHARGWPFSFFSP